MKLFISKLKENKSTCAFTITGAALFCFFFSIPWVLKCAHPDRPSSIKEKKLTFFFFFLLFLLELLYSKLVLGVKT